MPDWKDSVRRRLAPLRLKPEEESDLVEEVAQHLEDRFRELRSGGASDEEARRTAMHELDDLYPLDASVKESQRMPAKEGARAGEPAAGTLLEGIWKDLAYALRGMRKSPGFVLVVVMTLALGIGANTTVFTVINTLLLNPLPVRNAPELAAVVAEDARNTSRSEAVFPISYADLKDYRAQNQVFRSLACYTSARGLTLQENGIAQGIFGEFVTADYFSALGLAPARGRFFSPDEDSVEGAHPVAVLNYATWQTRFGGAEDIVGRQIQVNNVVLTIIGVAPPHFIGVNAIFGPDLWLPATMGERMSPNSMQSLLTDRGKAAFLAVGRVKPGVTMGQAAANFRAIAGSLARLYPETNESHGATVRPLRDVLVANSGTAGSSVVYGSAALSIVTAIVLLIACSNVANLLLARAAARQQEMAVRLAMGASRPRLTRQLLIESVLLGLISGAAGLALASAGLQFLFGQLPGGANFPTPRLDGTVLVFALAVSLATGLLFGAIPAWKAASANVAETLKEAGRSAGRSRRRVNLTNALVVGQVAFSFLLLVTAALFLRSIGRAYAVDPGFQTAHLAVFPTNPGQAGYDKSRAHEFYQRVRNHVAGLPGVESVSWASGMPLWSRSVTGLKVEGWQPRSRADQLRTVIDTVDLGYFDTAGVALESGRVFSSADRESSLPVAVVNEKLARDYWPDGALGKRVQLPGEKISRQVVGVVRTANYTSWGEPPQACVYVPLEQNYSDTMVLYVRSKAAPETIMASVEREVRAAGPQILIFGARTGSGIIDGGLFQARMAVGLLAVFGLLALGLASIGLYGVLAYSVQQRRREVGLRMALGATRAAVLKLVLSEGLSLVVVGIALGFAGAMAVGRLLSRMLFGVDAGDPLSVAAAALVLLTVALAACYLPARRATRVDPLTSLRDA